MKRLALFFLLQLSVTPMAQTIAPRPPDPLQSPDPLRPREGCRRPTGNIGGPRLRGQRKDIELAPNKRRVPSTRSPFVFQFDSQSLEG